MTAKTRGRMNGTLTPEVGRLTVNPTACETIPRCHSVTPGGDSFGREWAANGSDCWTRTSKSRRKDKRAECTHPHSVDARMVALAAAVEALSTGHARILAADLRVLLEAATGRRAIRGREPKG